MQHNSATPSPEDHVLGRVLHDHLPPWLALHCECSQLEAQTSLGYSDWMLNRCFVLSINNNVNNPSNPPATDTFFWNPQLTSKFGITYYQAYLQLKVQQSINFVCFFFTTQTQNYRKCSVQNIGRENRCSYIWHHLKFCDVGPWWIFKVVIGTCKTLDIIFYKLSNKATKKLYFEHFRKNTQLWAYSAHPRLHLKPENWIFWNFHTKINRNM